MAARYDWETIRAEYEAGASQSELAKRHGVSRTAIQKRIRSEGWMQDISGAINRLTEAKVAGVVAGCNPQKKAAALDRAADAKAAVILRHQAEWEEHKRHIMEALEESDFDKAKLAKITAETLKIRQEGERKAWGIQDVPQAMAQGGSATVKIDLSHMEPEKLAELVNMTEERAQRFFANEQH